MMNLLEAATSSMASLTVPYFMITVAEDWLGDTDAHGTGVRMVASASKHSCFSTRRRDVS